MLKAGTIVTLTPAGKRYANQFLLDGKPHPGFLYRLTEDQKKGCTAPYTSLVTGQMLSLYSDEVEAYVPSEEKEQAHA